MILGQARRPVWKTPLHLVQHGKAGVEFDAVTLAVVESHRLDALETFECPGKTGGRILAA